MKTILMMSTALVLMNSALASPVTDAAEKMKKNDTRTVITKETKGNACVAKGTYNVDLQVKIASYDSEKGEFVYNWETVKTINVAKDGSVTEVCAE